MTSTATALKRQLKVAILRASVIGIRAARWLNPIFNAIVAAQICMHTTVSSDRLAGWLGNWWTGERKGRRQQGLGWANNAASNSHSQVKATTRVRVIHERSKWLHCGLTACISFSTRIFQHCSCCCCCCWCWQVPSYFCMRLRVRIPCGCHCNCQKCSELSHTHTPTHTHAHTHETYVEAVDYYATR